MKEGIRLIIKSNNNEQKKMEFQEMKNERVIVKVHEQKDGMLNYNHELNTSYGEVSKRVQHDGYLVLGLRRVLKAGLSKCGCLDQARHDKSLCPSATRSYGKVAVSSFARRFSLSLYNTNLSTMKKYYIHLFALSMLVGGPVFSQDWIRMMQDPTVNVHDVQAAFNKWLDEQKAAGKVNEDKNPALTEESEANIQLFRRWEWYMEPRTYPTGERPDMAITAKNYNAYKAEMALHRTHATEATANWTYAGNSKVPTGGGDGRVNRIRFSPVNDSIMYVCSPAGGLWKSTNMGATWATNTDHLADLATSDIAINPLNTNIMYLATGDGDGLDQTTIGILKSYDGGNTWNPTGMSYTLQTSGPAYTTVNQLLIDPRDTNIILAATSFGLYQSTNSGATWTIRLAQNIKSIEFEPFHPSTVYLGTYYGQFYRSADTGHTFTLIGAGLPPSSSVGRLQVAVSPADSNVVYVLAENPSTSAFYGVYRSADRGQTFTTQSEFASGAPNLLGYAYNGADNTGQGWYTLSLAVSPTNADTILVGGVNIWRSGDRGVNWKLNAHWTATWAPYVHADIHQITFLPGSGAIYFAGCDGGVFKATNNGTKWTDISNDLEIAEQYSIGLSGSTPGLSISGWQDNGTNISGAPWVQGIGGDGMVCFIDYTNDATMFGSYQYGALEASFDGGVTWGTCTNNITESGPWTTRWLQDPQNYFTLFAGFVNVWESPDQGSSWGTISSFTGTATITAMAVAPSNDQYIYAAHSSNIYCTPDGGLTWNNITHTLPVGSASITGIAVSPTDPARLWVTFSGWSAANKVFESKDAGATWTNISTGLPNLPVNCVAYQPGSADGIYVGTEIGVYFRDTILGTWIDYSTGLPNVMIDDIKVFAPDNTVVAGTYGRGTWQSAGYPLSVNNIALSSSVKVYPNPSNGDVKVQFELPKTGDYTINVNDMLGQMVYTGKVHITGSTVSDLDMSAYAKGMYFVTVSKGSDKLVKKIVLY